MARSSRIIGFPSRDIEINSTLPKKWAGARRNGHFVSWRAKSQNLPGSGCLRSPYVARTLVKHVFDAVSGDAIYRKRSFLDGQIGESVASENVTIVDDARLIGGLGSSPFDDEGVATQADTRLIENGRAEELSAQRVHRPGN